MGAVNSIFLLFFSCCTWNMKSEGFIRLNFFVFLFISSMFQAQVKGKYRGWIAYFTLKYGFRAFVCVTVLRYISFSSCITNLVQSILYFILIFCRNHNFNFSLSQSQVSSIIFSFFSFLLRIYSEWIKYNLMKILCLFHNLIE